MSSLGMNSDQGFCLL